MEFFEYVPNYAFIAYVPADVRTQVRSLSFVRDLEPYHPVYKVSVDVPRDGIHELLVVAFPRLSVTEFTQRLTDSGISVMSAYERPNGILARVQMDATAVSALAADEVVSWIEPASSGLSDDLDRATRVTFSGLNKTFTHPLASKWSSVNGSTQSVGVCDGGLQNFADSATYPGHTVLRFRHVAFDDELSSNPVVEFNAYHRTDPLSLPAHRKVVAWYEPKQNGIVNNSTSGSHHGARVGGIVAGDAPPYGIRDNFDGVAYAAKLIVCDKDNVATVDDYSAFFTPTYTLGSNISTHSYGVLYNNGALYREESRQQDAFVWNHTDFVILRSMGNLATPGTMRTEAAAKNVIAVGATENSEWVDPDPDTPYAPSSGNVEKLWASSNRGPASDGRLKPNVVAPGACVTAPTNAGSPIGNTTLTDCSAGTSYSTPVVAGSVALVRDYFAKGFYPTGTATPSNSRTNLSAALIRAMIQISGFDIKNDPNTAFPNNDVGWGRVLLDDLLYFSGDQRRLLFNDSKVGLNTSQEWTETFVVNSTAEPLRVMLAWSDYPGTVGALKALVNDLDLTVTVGSGLSQKTFVGNNFNPLANTTLVGSALLDRLNVEEAVYVASGDAGVGTWTIKVRAHNVPNGPQPFAVVVVGDVRW